MDYGQWNTALWSHFEETSVGAKPYFFYVDGITLKEVGGFAETEDALDDFLEMIRVQNRPFFARALSTARVWKRNEYSGECPYLVVLALTVLSITEIKLHGNESVYAKLGSWMGLPDNASPTLLGYVDNVPELWKYFNEFLEYSTEFGLPTAKQVGRYSKQGFARSQGLITFRERRDIVQPFVQQIGTQESDQDFLHLFQEWVKSRGQRERSFTKKIFGPEWPTVIDTQDDSEILRSVIEAEIESQKSSSHSFKQRRLLRQGTVLYWDSGNDDEESNYYLEVERHRIAHSDSSESLFQYEREGKEYVEIPLDTEQLQFLLKGNRFALLDGLDFQGARPTIVAFRHDPNRDIWQESEVGGPGCIYLASSAVIALENALIERHPYLQAFSDEYFWAFGEAADLYFANYRPLRPVQEKSNTTLRFVGGLKNAGNKSLYIEGWLPHLLISQDGKAGGELTIEGITHTCPRTGFDLNQLGLKMGSYTLSCGGATRNFEVANSLETRTPQNVKLGVRDNWTQDVIVNGDYRPQLGGIKLVDSGTAEMRHFKLNENSFYYIGDVQNTFYRAVFSADSMRLKGTNIDFGYALLSYFERQVPRAQTLVEFTPLNKIRLFRLSASLNDADPDPKRIDTRVLSLILAYRRPNSFQSEAERKFFQNQFAGLGLVGSGKHLIEPNQKTNNRYVSWRDPNPLKSNSPTRNPYDDFVYFISERGVLNFPTAQEAWETIVAGTAMQEVSFAQARETLESLGFISVSFERRRICVNPPVAVPIERHAAFVLIGARKFGYIDALKDSTSSNDALSFLADAINLYSHIERDRRGLPLGPTSHHFVFDASDIDGVVSGLAELGTDLINTRASDLADSFNRSVSRAPYEVSPSPNIERFQIQVGQSSYSIRKVISDKAPGVYRYRLTGAYRYAVRDEVGNDLKALNYEEAILSLARSARAIEMHYESLTQEVWLKNSHLVPKRLKIVLSLCSGLPSRKEKRHSIEGQHFEGTWSVFRNVPEELVHTLKRVFDIPLEEF